MSEAEDGEGADFDEKVRFRRGRRVGFTDFRWEESQFKDWEPVRVLKTRLRELERKSSSSDILESLKNSEFVGKVKSSLVCYVFGLCIYHSSCPESFALVVRADNQT